MSPQNPLLIRFVLALLVLALVAIALVTFYRYASSPTDENLYTDQLSRVAFKEAPHARITWRGKSEFLEKLATIPGYDTLARGDLLLRINDKRIFDLAEVAPLVAGIPLDTPVTCLVHRPSTNIEGVMQVPARGLAAAHLGELPPGLRVVGVSFGGASDRAGMLVGDLIVAVNGIPFTSAQKADTYLRSGSTGRVFTYDVVRDFQQRTLLVTLAQFGFRLSTLIFILSGLIMMGIGAFIALKRPNLKAALLLGLAYILLGYVMAITPDRRDPVVDWFVIVRGIAMSLGILLGAVLLWNATLHFPVERRRALQHRWLVRLPYIAAFVVTGLLILAVVIWNPEGKVTDLMILGILGCFILYLAVVKIALRERLTPEQRALGVYLRLAGILTPVFFGILLALLTPMGAQENVGFLGIFFLLHPLAALYTIGRFRLLDMNLRIRRTLQYSLASVGWGTVVGVVALIVAGYLVSSQVALPTVSIHGASIEVGDTVAREAGQPNSMERLFYLGLGLLAWVGLAKARRGGQKLIDSYYARTRYDYRRALEEISSMLSTNLSMTALGKGIAAKLVDLMRLKRAAVLFFKNGTQCCCRESAGVEPEAWETFCIGEEDAVAIAAGGFSGPFSVDYLADHLRETFQRYGFQLLVPVRSKERLIAVLALGEKLSEAAYSADDFAFLGAVAGHASVAIENAFLYEELAEQERLKHELAIARRIQLASLPQTTPDVPGLQVSGRSVPAFEVGGDFYDFLRGPDGRLTVIVGDVSGKGTSAALYMSKVQGIFRSLHDIPGSLRDLLTKTNALLRGDIERSSFITVFAAVFEPSQVSAQVHDGEAGPERAGVARTVRLARAGHLPLYYFCASRGAVLSLTPRGMGLSMSDGKKFSDELEEMTLQAMPGDLFVLLTDGVTEARGAGQEAFGEERLLEVITRNAACDAALLQKQIFAAVAAFTGSVPQYDDQTVAVVKIV